MPNNKNTPELSSKNRDTYIVFEKQKQDLMILGLCYLIAYLREVF